MKSRQAAFVALPGFLGLLAALSGACGGNGNTTQGTGGGSFASGGSSSSGANTAGSGQGGGLFTNDGGPTCQGLQCQQAHCSGGVKTTVSGTVYDPKGDVPLYNVLVYVPNAPLDPLAEGASCDKCGATLSGEPIVSTLSDTKGHFVLENVPVGDSIPLVMQVGKWRRQVTLPVVTECVDNPVTDPNLTRLPRNQSEGHLPRIALSTGGADPLECLLRKIGIDDAEFTPESGTGRVNLFAGAGGTSKYAAALNGGTSFSQSMKLWGDTTSLMAYDVVLLACEGGQHTENKPTTAIKAMADYAGKGGRVFASHWHNVWLEEGPDPWPKTATFHHQADLADPFTADIDTSFPKGQALSDWLLNVGGTDTAGKVVIHAGQHTVDVVNTAMSRQWIYSTSPQSVQYFTFNTPIGVEEDKQCGRVVFSDIHVSSSDKINVAFPNGCTSTGLSAQEKALLFMLFDLSACIMDDGDPPVPPVN
ncbi:MAG: carboxypeptidase regulatory-like domain-containing protein [Minicystis sp.]